MRVRAFVAALLCLAVSSQALAASVMLEELTSPEVREAVAAGKTTILIPIGGTEQNGPHMVLGKHNVRATDLAQRIAAILGTALVAPVVAYVPEGAIDPPTGHMKFAGTISIPEDAFEKTLEGAARSFGKAGFRDIVLLGDHGGYRRSLDRVSSRLNAEWSRAKSPARVHALPDYYRELLHAGREDTALTLALGKESLVRKDRMNASAVGQGAAQDPSGATLESGRAALDATVERTVAAIRKATARR